MSRKTLLAVAALLLLISLTCASRPVPAHPSDSSHQTQQGIFDEENIDGNEGCDGVGEEECLMRRTLVAHTDYIYTQSKKP
ncbi:phytosulfokines-like [Magnolia sinica]|uniref:phytosulfokines-like n=1 Tax=Magnolia sinica TaxID=86752 RepID=UPI00265AE31D|nr:phytosulfokines-like [Magnolia sinica]